MIYIFADRVLPQRLRGVNIEPESPWPEWEFLRQVLVKFGRVDDQLLELRWMLCTLGIDKLLKKLRELRGMIGAHLDSA